ncbi:uncharacterized protein EDB91DRAFT_1045536 [Suillus paluster]|uniref:uncharacterized protein n=1 Tax=Suillus paluster TaxID=48578 RepID=UPI001B87D4B8|nr:uncharacterized protein EDB91DRAFT_1045536 [Suillus paluster]KAG1751481.1 hypothetical protein EDB91DRAFT_1045536 [Suillus paluster]
MSALQYMIPDATVIKDTIEVNFNITLCKFQLQYAQAQLDQKDVITIAPMGAGKTLTFWIPLLFNNDGMVVLITALNRLSDQSINELQQLGISAVNLTGANAIDSTIQGMSSLFHYHCMIIVSPELIINNWCFNNLWRARDFMVHLFNICYVKPLR